MADLKQLQQHMADFVRSYDNASSVLTDDIVSDGISAAQRMQIYRNNFFESVSGALLDVFPVSVAFVGDVFLRQSLKAFALALPPTAPILHAYGSGFPDFLRSFEPAAGVPYLADLADLEWQTHELMLVDEKEGEFDVTLCTEAASKDELRLSSNVRFISSDYPVFDLWLAATGQISADDVDMEKGGQAILIMLRDGQISYEPMESEVAALSRVLSLGRPVPQDLVGQIPQLIERSALAIIKKELNNE